MFDTITTFLTVLARLAAARNGVDDDVARFFRIGASLVDKGAQGKDAFEAATAKMRELVDENRSMTDEENLALEESIADKLARAAAVDLNTEGGHE